VLLDVGRLPGLNKAKDMVEPLDRPQGTSVV